MRLYLIVVLIYLTVLISDVEHFFHVLFDVQHLCVCFLAICMSSLEKCLFESFIFLIELFFIIELHTLELVLSLYTLESNLLLVTSFANIFSHSVGCLFILRMVPLAVQKLLSLIMSCLFIFVFYFHYSRR